MTLVISSLRPEDGGAGGDVPRGPGQGRLLHAAEEAAGECAPV